MARPFAQTLAHGMCVQASSTVATRRASATAAAYENPTCGLRSGGYTGRSAHGACSAASDARAQRVLAIVCWWLGAAARASASHATENWNCMHAARRASSFCECSGVEECCAPTDSLPGTRGRDGRETQARAVECGGGDGRFCRRPEDQSAGAALAAAPPALLYS